LAATASTASLAWTGATPACQLSAWSMAVYRTHRLRVQLGNAQGIYFRGQDHTSCHVERGATCGLQCAGPHDAVSVWVCVRSVLVSVRNQGATRLPAPGAEAAAGPQAGAAAAALAAEQPADEHAGPGRVHRAGGALPQPQRHHLHRGGAASWPHVLVRFSKLEPSRKCTWCPCVPALQKFVMASCARQ